MRARRTKALVEGASFRTYEGAPKRVQEPKNRNHIHIETRETRGRVSVKVSSAPILLFLELPR